MTAHPTILIAGFDANYNEGGYQRVYVELGGTMKTLVIISAIAIVILMGH